jgi:methyl-accepting chemotaxis protein
MCLSLGGGGRQADYISSPDICGDGLSVRGEEIEDMKSWTIGKRLTFGFGSVIAIVMALTAFVVIWLGQIDRSANVLIQDSLPGIQHMARAELLVRQSMVQTFHHILSPEDAKKAAIEQEMDGLSAETDKAYAGFEESITRPQDRELFDAIGPARQEYIARRKELLALSRTSKGDTRESLIMLEAHVAPARDKYLSAIRASLKDKVDFAEVNTDALTNGVASARYGVIIGALASLLVGMGLALHTVRTVSAILRTSLSELVDGAQQVTAAATQIAGSAQSLSHGATQQAASLEETSASMEEMASMTRRNAENSQQAAVMMADTDTLVRGANASLAEMVVSMSTIKESSDKVAKIIKTIDEIAFQTNILALNAAVEAARAGEAGMGFAVVADEVRSLAQRSAQAAKDTASLIDDSIASASAGHQRVTQVSTSIHAITDSAGKVKALVDEVSVASNQQAQGIDQVAQSIAQMEKVTQRTAATAEESAAASEELSAQAEISMGVVGRLAALVGGASGHTPRKTVSASKKSSPPAAPRATKRSRVLSMSKPVMRSAEDEIPLEGSGTYGKF